MSFTRNFTRSASRMTIGAPFPLLRENSATRLGSRRSMSNRILQSLRASGLITYKSGKLTIHDWNALTKLAQFDPAYLHLKPKAGS